jgi:hypothetical protein
VLVQTLDSLEKKFPSAPEELVAEPTSFLDFEPVSGRLARRLPRRPSSPTPSSKK